MAVSQNSLDNLIHAPKGYTANPSGRPKGLDIFGRIKKFSELSLNDINGMIEDDKTKAIDLMALQYAKRALNGDLKATEYLIDRIEGKPTTTAIVATNEGINLIGTIPTKEQVEMMKRLSDTVNDASIARTKLLKDINPDVT